MNKKDIPEYRAWKAMKARCYSPCNQKMGNYKKNNITVCHEWLNDFERFYLDMGSRPSNKHSLDRINNFKGYSKDNCKWSTQDEQCKNRGDFNNLFDYKGEVLVLKDWAKKFNINYPTLHNRIYRNNLSFEDAIKDDPYKKIIEINGEKNTLKNWCILLDKKYTTVVCRISRGWDKIKALTTPTPNNKEYDLVLVRNQMIDYFNEE